jgi:CheY-like chemotaxis protein
VVTAPDGAEALRLAFEHPPDLMVLDVMMPRIDGYGVTRAIRQHPRPSACR